MLSKNKIKYIHSLELKKTRKEEQVFLAEGPKLTGDLLGHFPCRFLAATSSWLQAHPDIQANEIAEVSQEELSRASLLKTPQQVLAVFEQPQYTLSPGDPGYDYPAGGLVWYRTYYLLSEHGRRIQSQDHTSHYGRNRPC